MNASSSPTPSGGSTRLLALDALRGFDMFWIIGGDALVHALRKLSSNSFVTFLSDQLEHKEWEGFAFYDLIFPLFVFMVGVSLVFSLGRIIESEGRAKALARVARRALLLFVIGIFYYGGFANKWPDIRLVGVLQRIALAYFFAGLAFCFLRWRGLAITCVVLLAGYWALLTFVPAPGSASVTFAETGNLADYVDQHFLPGKKWYGHYDPEGLLSTFPAIASCLLGVLAGMLIRFHPANLQKKVNLLGLAGVALLALGFIWGTRFPIIKKIWTSSYVLVAGGYSVLLLAAFLQMIEIWNWRRWCIPFVWLGVNAITIYLADNIIDFGQLGARFAGGDIATHLGSAAPLLITIFGLSLEFLLAWYLYRKKIFLRL